MRYRTRERIESCIIYGILGIAAIFVGFLLIGAVTGHIDPKCVHFLSPPPDNIRTENGRVVCD